MLSVAMPILLTLGEIFPGNAPLYIAISLALAVSITAFFYLLSNLLNHPPLNALAKEELAALILSVFIIGGWIFTQVTLNTFSCSAIFGSCDLSTTHFAVGHLQMAWGSLEVLFQKLKSIYLGLYTYEVLIGFLSTVYVPLGTFNPLLALVPASFPPLVGLSMLSNAHTVLVEAIGMVMIAVVAKQQLLNFAQYSIPLVLLPMGLVLRAVPLYRTTGSSIIAICVCLYFIYPLTVVLSNYMIFDLYKPADFAYAPSTFGFCQAQKEGQDPTDALKDKSVAIGEFRELIAANAYPTESIQTPKSTAWWEKLINFVAGIGKTISSLASILWTMATVIVDFWSGIKGLFGQYSVITGLYNFIIDEVVIVSQFVIVVIVTSVFEIIITVTMYRNISLLIGGEVDIAGLSKLV
jgi:hypothetical protein